MSDNKKRPPVEPEQNSAQPSAMQKRWFWIRTILLTVLIFVFIMWYTYPSNGNVAILWSAGLAGAVLGYFVLSYYRLYR
ncbi:MAG: hypothetical protein KIS95_04530 [Anaerolineae bacterium]|uniref:hypothetical protein n=1 Tax=Promineifilum sp. TaxID=2664178 RepID=UPI001D84D07E|nr:hypothetical protein [Anaerolineales bacterium]MCB8935421.1 hypothetical protein [Promineifilum sp.]MCO5181571.1 hypothetical protein [Promineifilum sp.]MCW5846472.1 hypothetical protein [Anaerolineae bacterium]